jgi:hypothetical protein
MEFETSPRLHPMIAPGQNEVVAMPTEARSLLAIEPPKDKERLL